MATINYSANTIAPIDHATFTWAPMANGDVGQQVGYAGTARSFQVTGTFGLAGSATIEGSNDGTNWFALKDTTGAVIAITAAGRVDVGNDALYVRPRVTAGDGTTSLTAILSIRKNVMNY